MLPQWCLKNVPGKRNFVEGLVINFIKKPIRSASTHFRPIITPSPVAAPAVLQCQFSSQVPVDGTRPEQQLCQITLKESHLFNLQKKVMLVTGEAGNRKCWP